MAHEHDENLVEAVRDIAEAIRERNNSMTPEDQAALDKILSRVKHITRKLEALDRKTPKQ